MRNLLTIMLLLAVTMSAFAQKAPRRKARAAGSQTQLCGTVQVMTGNRMPAANPGMVTGTVGAGTPVVREVLVFRVMSLDSLTQDEGGFFQNVTAKPVATVKTDKAGKFCVKLPAGQYSVLTREAKGLYANMFDTKNRVNVATIQPSKTTSMVIIVSNGAAY